MLLREPAVFGTGEIIPYKNRFVNSFLKNYLLLFKIFSADDIARSLSHIGDIIFISELSDIIIPKNNSTL